MNRKNSLIAAALIVTGMGCYVLFFTSESPEAQVRRQLNEFCDAASKTAGESGPRRILKAEKINTLMNNPVVIKGDASILAGNYSPEELSSRIFTGSRMFEAIRLSYTDLTITVNDDTEATASFTAKVSGTPKSGTQGSLEEFRQVAAKLKVTEDRWVFTEFKVINVMEK